MTDQQEKTVEEKIREYGKKVQLDGMIAGANGILGAILKMCIEGKNVDDIKEFCEKSIGLDVMKKK